MAIGIAIGVGVEALIRSAAKRERAAMAVAAEEERERAMADGEAVAMEEAAERRGSGPVIVEAMDGGTKRTAIGNGNGIGIGTKTEIVAVAEAGSGGVETASSGALGDGVASNLSEMTVNGATNGVDSGDIAPLRMATAASLSMAVFGVSWTPQKGADRRGPNTLRRPLGPRRRTENGGGGRLRMGRRGSIRPN